MGYDFIRGVIWIVVVEWLTGLKRSIRLGSVAQALSGFAAEGHNCVRPAKTTDFPADASTISPIRHLNYFNRRGHSPLKRPLGPSGITAQLLLEPVQEDARPGISN